MDFPQSNTSAQASGVTGQAVDPTNGRVANTVNAINDFDVTADIEITIINASADTDATDFALFYGAGETPAALPAGLSVISPFATLTDLRDYVKNVPIQVTACQFDTDDAANNYTGNIKVSERRPNNTLATRTIKFADYRLSNGGGQYQNVLNVNDGKERFTIGPSVKMVVSKIKFGTRIIIRITVPANGRVYEMTAVKY